MPRLPRLCRCVRHSRLRAPASRPALSPPAGARRHPSVRGVLTSWLAAATCLAVAAEAPAPSAGTTPSLPAAVLLEPARFERHVKFFNAMEDEPAPTSVTNAEAWAWLAPRVPRFECADRGVEEIYWFRWWALRKQLRQQPDGTHVFGEFINKPRPVSSALGHHLMEGRWLRDPRFHDEYLNYWLRGNAGKPQDHLHKYSQWLQHAVWQRWLVTQDTAALTAQLDTLVADYRQWETEKRTADGLFWQHDVWDAMEESISGGRRTKNLRPPLNSYMFGNATALAAIARVAGRAELAAEFDAKAAEIRAAVEAKLWDADAKFFKVRLETGPLAGVRESIGFIPWYFGLPSPGKGYEAAWAQFADDRGFRAPFGLTTAERRHPEFRSHGIGTCEWDGAVWPFATSQTLSALGRALREDPAASAVVSKRDWFAAFLTFTRSQHYAGMPYIGEYLDERTGQWLKGRDQRSRWYNHSTFADLVIAELIGIRPRADDVLEIDPLIPADAWPWFALDGVNYHGRELTIGWDRDGSKYGRGAGLRVWVDGTEVASLSTLGKILVNLPKR